MPNYIGGDVTELSCTHPTLGVLRFQAKATDAFTLDKGGIRTNDDSNGVTGDGTMIQIKSRVRWSLEGNVAVDMLADIDINGWNDLAENATPSVWTLSHISGAVYKGTGVPVGDLQTDTNAATLKIKIAGGGKLEMIA